MALSAGLDSTRRAASAGTQPGNTDRPELRPSGAQGSAAGHATAALATPARAYSCSGVRAAGGRIPWALLAYACFSIVLFGHGVIGSMHTAVVGFGQGALYYGRDQSAFVWFLAWGAHAFAHLQNPFITHEVFVPRGYNLAWATSILGPAIVLAPLTLTIGAIPTFNLLALSAPATSAWAAYLLCRELTVRRPSAFVGGLLFGFGTYESVEMINHVNLALTALVPLAGLLIVRRARGRITRRRFVLALGVTVGVQAWISTEVFASMTVLGALALALAYLLGDRRQRSIVRAVAVEAVGACALALVIAAPYLWYGITSANPLAMHPAPVDSGSDLANLLTPTHATLLRTASLSVASRLGGNLTEQASYIGPLILLILLAFALEQRRRWMARTIIAGTVAAVLLSLGGHLIVAGRLTGVPLPWDLIGQLPLIKYALPDRFTLYMWLGIAVAVAVWLDSPRRRRTRSALVRWALTAAALVTLIPNFVANDWRTPVHNPPLLSGHALARYVTPGSIVLALPFGTGGDEMYWQAEAKFAFRLAGGYLSWALPSGYNGLSIIHELNGRRPRAQLASRLCSFIRMTGARTILLKPHAPGDWAADLRPLHVKPLRAGGLIIYQLGPASCARPQQAGPG